MPNLVVLATMTETAIVAMKNFRALGAPPLERRGGLNLPMCLTC